jgi:phage gpG-like protein
MGIEVGVTGEDELWARLDAQVVHDEMQKGLEAVAIRIMNMVKKDKLSGQVLNNVTGTLRRSINERMAEEDGDIVAYVGSFAGYTTPKGVPSTGYAAVHEFGGVFNVPEHTRRALTMLGSKAEGATVAVKAHTATYPERSFLRSTLRENRQMINTGIMNSLKRAMRIGAL